MAATALECITDALQKIGVYAPGEVVSAADAERGRITLNDMLDSWSNESLMCYAIKENSFLLTPGIAAYTVGLGGAFDTTRPLKILTGPGTCYLQDNNLNNYNINVIPQDQWNLIGTRAVNSNVPDTLFYDPQFPLGIINLFPTPNIAYTLFFDSYLQLVDFTDLTQTLSLPPGYAKAIKDNLAIELHPYFAASQISPIIIESASRSKGNIKRLNTRDNVALYDPEIVSKSTPTYNIYNDSYTV